MMRISAKMSGLENGYEQLFIRPTEIGEPPIIPEPASLAIWSLLSVTGCVGVARRRFARKTA